MSDLPLNAVENTRDNSAQTVNPSSHLSKSPYKLSTTEKRVIGGLKQLTELLFKQHYKHNSIGQAFVDQIDAPLQSDEVTTSTEYPTSTDMVMKTDKENDEHFQQNPDDATNSGAEIFCGMVVQQLTAGDQIDHSEEWHRGQLDAYNWAHERLFERAD